MNGLFNMKIYQFAIVSLILSLSISLSYQQIIVGIFFTLFIYFFIVDLGWHRYFCHKSLYVSTYWENLFLFFGIFTGMGSPIVFISTHRWHHKYSDTPKDIHSPHHLPILHILTQNVSKVNVDPKLIVMTAKDWIKDKRMKFYHKHSYNILFFLVILISIIDFTWLVPLLAWPILITYVTTVLFAGLLQHFVGERIANDKSGNSKLLSYISLGFIAGHSNHHFDPSRYSWSVDNDHFDLGGEIAKVLKWDRK